MTSELTYRLRHEATSKEAGMLEQGGHASDRYKLLMEAADEIERLRAIAENAEALRRNLEDVSCRQQNEIERLRALLAEMPDLIKDIDGGNPETSTGWASQELCDLWMRVHSALEPKT